MQTNLLRYLSSRDYGATKRSVNDKRFANNWFKAGPLQSKELKVHHSDIFANLALSNDQSFVVTGGCYQSKESVLKWPMWEAFGIQSELKPTVVYREAQTYNADGDDDNEDNDVRSVAISRNDRRIFSSNWNQRVFVHDVERGQVLHRIPQGQFVWGISVQPSSFRGDVFATGDSDDGVLHIFDVRSSTIGAVIKIETAIEITDVAFSPAVANHVAVCGGRGGKILDIRQPNQIFSVISTNKTNRIQYNSSGNRLLFLKDKGPQVIDLPTFFSGNEEEGKKNPTTGEDQNNKGFYWMDNGGCCFAGENDELVVAVSKHRHLHVWSIPEGRFDDSTTGGAVAVEHLMHFLASDDVVGLCFSKVRSALISAGFGDDIINVWTPFRLPQQPSIENGIV